MTTPSEHSLAANRHVPAGARAVRLTRRTLLASAGVASVLRLPDLTSSAWARSPDALQDWLAADAIAVRTVDPLDEDFSDLEPLAELIGDARVVQLGEPSHAAGTCFAAKARLCKFLHQRMGFGVVAWESGFYDVELTEAGLRAGDDAVTAARRGILVNWSAAEEIRPLFEYAKASHGRDRPLVMAGFDMSGTRPFADLAEELRAYVGGLRDPGRREDAMTATEEVIAAFSVLNAYVEAQAILLAELIEVTGDARTQAFEAWERDVGAPLRPRREALDRLHPAVDRLVRLFETEAAAFAAIEGERRRGFMAHNVVNLGARGVNLYERYAADLSDEPEAVVQENRRDALNAENMRWLIEEGFPDRKLIVWAHNAHVMNAYYLAPDFKRVSLDPVPNAMKPTGVFLAERLGDDLYTIGFTAYEGEDGWVGLQAGPIAPASEGSLEARLHQLALAYAVLDLRGARGVADHPLQEPQTVRVPKYDEVEIDSTGPYDAMFFIARMERATLIR